MTRTLASRIGTKLGIAPASLSADKAFGRGPLLGWLVDRNITFSSWHGRAQYVPWLTNPAQSFPAATELAF